MAVTGSGGASDGGDGTGRWPQSKRWISYAELRVNAQVTSVQVAERLLDVPWHGPRTGGLVGTPAPARCGS